MNVWPDLIILFGGWLVIFTALCLGLYFACPVDPFDAAFSCQECNDAFGSLREYELHECCREARGAVRRAS